MNKGKLLGYVLAITGLVLISFPNSITGAVIGINVFKEIKIIFGFVFVIAGLVLIISKLEKKYGAIRGHNTKSERISKNCRIIGLQH
ncbi:MAG TPA: hypothetical protein VJ208_01935 [Candidatus Nanoarchaeia archaeon]|nr:hypothetical protein [Candidatus Nanoarchaeia archaeon]